MSLNTKTKILVVDDEKYICNLIKDFLGMETYDLSVYIDPDLALKHLDCKPVDLVLTDLIMGSHSGIEILDAALKHNHDAIVILMTAHPTIETVISVLKNGAYDFLVKPFKMELLKATIERGLEHQSIRRENLELKGQVEFLKTTSFSSSIDNNIERYLANVVKSCKKEIGAVAAGVIILDPSKAEFNRKVHESDEEQYIGEVLDDSTLEKFTYTKSPQPAISIREVSTGESKKNRIKISQPIFVGRTLTGVINILAFRKFDRVLAGEIQMLGILSNFAASSIANWRMYNDLQKSYLNAIKGLAKAIEARDAHTAGHTDRVSKLAEIVARHLSWEPEQVRNLVMGCMLHDIGKIGIPDAVLNKTSQLSKKEFEWMEKHTELGLQIIEGIDLFKPAIPYIASHHERFDGKGYPSGLSGEGIPIEGRLLAVVDTLDAILSDRPYRAGAELKVAISEIAKKTGSQFDPQMVRALFDVIRCGDLDLKKLYNCTEDLASIPELQSTEKAPA